MLDAPYVVLVSPLPLPQWYSKAVLMLEHDAATRRAHNSSLLCTFKRSYKALLKKLAGRPEPRDEGDGYEDDSPPRRAKPASRRSNGRASPSPSPPRRGSRQRLRDRPASAQPRYAPLTPHVQLVRPTSSPPLLTSRPLFSVCMVYQAW